MLMVICMSVFGQFSGSVQSRPLDTPLRSSADVPLLTLFRVSLIAAETDWDTLTPSSVRATVHRRLADFAASPYPLLLTAICPVHYHADNNLGYTSVAVQVSFDPADLRSACCHRQDFD